ncbi:dTDP-4-dehydrorhamnose 3,5-epimerase [uncultured Selenomonas sp.]|uniref:dTDP-4-dehydrorhamnose 3,5-epimerase n=1 Tax=uncultured Selenomonas sp. TaxID=159275 RepID=UPI0025E3BC21|nr:dTDP-4-dehydrorhamnose 3,5-epimerase [uncultured Selenomonas sp.]
MIQKKETLLSGCYELIPEIFRDARGSFIKTFHKDWFQSLGLPTDFGEEYTSRSHARVLRGLHFQLPPEAHGKLIYCSEGEVLDVAVDLRHGPTYGQYEMTKLTAERGNMAYIPVGCAHGFYTLSEKAVIVCKQTKCYAPEQDAGIRWDSAGIPWPDMHPILSEKDQKMPKLSDFESPF